MASQLCQLSQISLLIDSASKKKIKKLVSLSNNNNICFSRKVIACTHGSPTLKMGKNISRMTFTQVTSN